MIVLFGSRPPTFVPRIKLNAIAKSANIKIRFEKSRTSFQPCTTNELVWSWSV